MKQYSVKFSVAIHDKATTYPEIRPFDISITENLPAGVDPDAYVRRRIAEELTRSFSQLSVKIENFEGDAPAVDPLA